MEGEGEGGVLQLMPMALILATGQLMALQTSLVFQKIQRRLQGLAVKVRAPRTIATSVAQHRHLMSQRLKPFLPRDSKQHGRAPT
jgi:hypothetical protein